MDFETVYTEMFTLLYKYVFWRVRDSDITMDIIQNVFMKAFEKYQEKSLEDIRKLLYVLARNEIIDRGKKKKVSTFDPFDNHSLSIPDHSDGPERLIGMRESQEYLAELMENYLEDHEREALLLRYIQEKEYSEIAEILGKSESSLRQIISRSLKKLRVAYEHYEPK